MYAVGLLLALALGATSGHLSEARRLYEALDFPAAEAHLRLAKKTSLTQEDRREVHHLLVRILAARSDVAEAQQVYVELLGRDPNAPPPENVAPRIREIFLQAKMRVFPADFVSLSARPAGDHLELTLIDPWSRIDSLRIEERAEGRPPHTYTMAPSVTRVPEGAGRDRGSRVEVRITALDSSGEAIAEAGSAGQPLVLEPHSPVRAPAHAVQAPSTELQSEPGRGRWSKRAGWLLVGAGAVAAATGVVLGVSSAQTSRRASDSGSAEETRSLDSRARGQALAANWLVGGALVGAGAGSVLVIGAW